MSALRAMARLAVIIGAIGAVALMLYVGRRNRSYWLLAMFVAWDVAPFAALALADRYAARWSAATQKTLYIVTLIITVMSLGLYTDVVVRPRPQPAAMFLLAPVASWLLMATAIPMAACLSRKESTRR